jgi:DNA-binding transcriptional ArsR family regulator
MPKYQNELNQVFAALSDPTRRGVLQQLSTGDKSVSELAQHYDMALPSFTQHMQVLEKSGLVSSSKQGRTRIYSMVPDKFNLAEDWLEQQKSQWNQRLDQLDANLLEMKENLQ